MFWCFSDKNWHKQTNKLIASERLNDALTAIQSIVERVFCEPVNVARVFGTPTLDEMCQAVGKITLERHAKAGFTTPEGAGLRGGDLPTVYLVSRLQASGGHTAALADVIRAAGAARSVVIATGTCGPPGLDAVKAKLSEVSGVTFEQAPPGSRLSKLEWIQRRLTQLKPTTVWLFNHHQDSVAVAAVQPEQGYQVCFYHHGDHHMCLGVHLSYAEHYDPHPMGFHNCRDVLGIRRNHYLPLVVPDQGDRPNHSGFLQAGRLITCTAAGPNKLEVPYAIQYVDVVPELLSITGGKHIHIGRLTLLARWRILLGMRRLGVPSNAFVYVPYVPSVWRALHTFRVDLYVSSFPYGGGRTLVEVMGAGVPSLMHEHHASRMLGGVDMAYNEAVAWRTKRELFEALRAVDSQSLERQSRAARARYERFHRADILTRALAAPEELQVPELRTDYQSDSLSRALEDSYSVNLWGLLYRLGLRTWLRWKSSFGLLV